MNPNLMNGSNLAYIGDAYYELRVREYLLSLGITKNKELRKISIGYVSANAHQIIYNKLATELNEEEKAILEEKLIETYKIKNINFDDNSLYKEIKVKNKIKKIFKTEKDMPILEDLYNILPENVTIRYSGVTGYGEK